MTLVDLLLAGYLAWGVSKGWRRKIGRELQALIKLLLLLAWLWGFDTARWLRDTLGGALQSNPVTAGMLGSLLAIVIAFILLHWLRDRLAEAIEARLSPIAAHRGGAASGLLRTLAWGCALILLLQQVPWIGDSFTDSLTNQLLSFMF